MKSFKELREKAVSQQQQKLMGLALAYKRGEISGNDISPEAKAMADKMSEKDLEDFAKTKHDKLPVKKEETGEKEECPKCKGKGCDHCDNKGYHVNEAKDDAEYNDEGGMAISQLKTAKSAVEELMSIIKDNDNLPEWVQSKLTKAVDYMDSVRDYMSSEKDGVQEAVKTTHVVIDTANGNKVVATASSEQGAKSSVASAERPPMNIKDKKTLKIVKLKKPVGDKQTSRMVGFPLKEAKGKYASDAQVEAVKVGDKVKFKKGIDPKTARRYGDAIRKSGKVVKDYGDGDVKVNFGGNNDKSVDAKLLVKEAVSPAQQAAIAIAKKEKGEEPKKESRAYRDAMRGMKGRGATVGMAKTKKDKDIEATDDDRKAASKNIIMQLRKAADLPKGAEVEFERGKGKVSRDQAQSALAKFNALAKPVDKERFQNSIKSLADIKKILGR